jgi:hypothetical protein
LRRLKTGWSKDQPVLLAGLIEKITRFDKTLNCVVIRSFPIWAKKQAGQINDRPVF